MKRYLSFIFLCLLLSKESVSQSIIRFEVNGQNHFCSSSDPFPSFNVNSGSLQVTNPGGSTCDSWTVLELQIHNFTGPGTYSFDYGSGNYGFYDSDTVPPSWSTPDYPSDPGGGTATITQYDSTLGILEGTFSMVVSKHMFDSTDFTTLNITNGYFKFGTCAITFNLEPDTLPGHWWLYYHAQGVYPLVLNFDWGDGSSTTGTASHTYASAGNYNICLTMADNTSCITTYCDSSVYIYKKESAISISVVDEVATGMRSAISDPPFSLSPNPATSTLTITIDAPMKTYHLTITDITGRTALAAPLSAQHSILDIGNLANGMYLVSLSDTDRSSATRKLIISR